MPKNTLPDWELVLAAAARLQGIVPRTVLVGGTASAIYAQHRFSRDADHILDDLSSRYDQVLSDLEAVAGWKTARTIRPVQILGSLNGIETGIRQLIRDDPLETIRIEYQGAILTIPTQAEILRIKAVLILKRNATRDYLDFVALADQMEDQGVIDAFRTFDKLYPQSNNESALQQLQIQLANPLPYDLEETALAEYKNLAPQWHDWEKVKSACVRLSLLLFDHASEFAGSD